MPKLRFLYVANKSFKAFRKNKILAKISEITVISLPSEDSGYSGHLRSLIRILVIHMCNHTCLTVITEYIVKSDLTMLSEFFKKRISRFRCFSKD